MDCLQKFCDNLAEHVWTAGQREGNSFTLREVKAEIDGSPVPGKARHDVDQIKGLIAANRLLYKVVSNGQFRVDKGTFCRLHSVIAKHEALGAGFFRGEQPGPVMSGGTVQLANGGTYQAPQDGIAARFNEIVSDSQKVESEVDRACFLFCHLARLQPFFDGNKRTSLALANGLLMSSGHDAILIPAKDRALYNNLLDKLFAEGDTDSMSRYLRSLLADPHT